MRGNLCLEQRKFRFWRIYDWKERGFLGGSLKKESLETGFCEWSVDGSFQVFKFGQ